MRTELERDRFGKAENARLGGGVFGIVRLALNSDGAGDQDDAAASLRRHILRRLAGAEHRAAQVRGEHGIEHLDRLLCELLHGAAGAASGAADEHVQLPVGKDAVERRVDGIGARYIDEQRLRLQAVAADLVDHLHDGLLAASAHIDAGALGGEAHADGAADRAGAAGDDGGFASELRLIADLNLIGLRGGINRAHQLFL